MLCRGAGYRRLTFEQVLRRGLVYRFRRLRLVFTSARFCGGGDHDLVYRFRSEGLCRRGLAFEWGDYGRWAFCDSGVVRRRIPEHRRSVLNWQVCRRCL